MGLRHFRLAFSPSLGCAFFPFLWDDEPLPGMGCAVSSRSLGNMLYPKDRERLYCSLGLEPERVFACTQVHSRRVLAADRESPMTWPEADGMVSGDSGLCLSVTVADCLPVFLYHPGSGAFGLVHSGWRGTGIVLAALALMEERWGAQAGEIAAVLGPCIQGCCYRTDQERAAEFEAAFGGNQGPFPLGPVVRHVPPEAYYLDLPAANARLLAKAGVRHITVCDDCTFTDERLGSFRREGAGYTRMAALAGPSVFVERNCYV